MDREALTRVARAVEAVSAGLDALEEAGRGVPAVEKNVTRMRGTLRQLEVQFCDLDAVASEEAR